MAEVLVRDDLLWRPVALLFGLALAFTMPWRRARPLATVAVAFGTLAMIDLASALTADAPFFPYAGAFVLVLL